MQPFIFSAEDVYRIDKEVELSESAIKRNRKPSPNPDSDSNSKDIGDNFLDILVLKGLRLTIEAFKVAEQSNAQFKVVVQDFHNMSPPITKEIMYKVL